MHKYAIKFILVSLITLLFVSCGYKPSSKFSREVIGEKISTSIVISSQDPENTVIIKDAVDQAIIEVFHASITKRSYSDTHLEIKVDNPVYTPIVYNENGFVVGYIMNITLNITRYHNGISKKYKSSGSFDFVVQPNAVVSDQERFEAIKYSAHKAVLSFIAQVSADGARSKK